MTPLEQREVLWNSIKVFFDSNFFQSLTTFIIGGFAVYFANKIGQKQNKISGKILELSTNIALIVTLDDELERLIVDNKSDDYIILYSVKIDDAVIKLNVDSNITPSNMKAEIKIEKWAYEKYFKLREVETSRVVLLQLFLKNSLDNLHTAIFQIILDKKNKPATQILSYKKGWS